MQLELTALVDAPTAYCPIARCAHHTQAFTSLQALGNHLVQVHDIALFDRVSKAASSPSALWNGDISSLQRSRKDGRIYSRRADKKKEKEKEKEKDRQPLSPLNVRPMDRPHKTAKELRKESAEREAFRQESRAESARNAVTTKSYTRRKLKY